MAAALLAPLVMTYITAYVTPALDAERVRARVDKAEEARRQDRGIRHEIGLAYYFSAPEFEAFADTNADPYRSPAFFCEDNQSLGPAHSLHEDIRTLGRGRFSHWYGHVLFSTPDGSDPLTNSRSYRLTLDANC
jgi:hypothetical protein